MKVRFKALERQRHPDQLDSPLLLATPRGWVAVFTVLITTVMIGLWGFLGSIPRYASASGLITFPGGVVTVESAVAGSLTGLTARSGERVAVGTAIATVRTPGGGLVGVTAPVNGRVVAVNAGVGSYVSPGDDLIQIEQTADAELGATLLIGSDMVPFVHPNQEVTLALPGVNPRIFGRLKGVVVSISDFPASAQQLAQVTGEQGQALDANTHLVVVKLLGDPATVSGYQWTSVAGPPVSLRSRTPVTGELSLGGVRPVSILLGV